MSKRHSVIQWNKRAMQAAQMRCGACADVAGSVGIDFVAQDGHTFAHGHLNIANAREFHQLFGEAIEEAARVALTGEMGAGERK